MTEYYEANKSASINADFIDHSEVDIESKDMNAEDKLIKLQKYNSLSQEAKEVVSLVINTPAEILGLITTPNGKKTKKLIINFLHKKWSKFIVEKVIDELTKLAKSF